MRIELDLQRLAPSLENSAFTYGFNTAYLKTIANHWQSKFNWRDQEVRLNAFPQFTTSLDGIDVHFLHVKPDPVKAKGKTVLPLMIVHGWPGQ